MKTIKWISIIVGIIGIISLIATYLMSCDVYTGDLYLDED